MASNILGKISKERTISAVVIVIVALAAILPGGIILAAVLYIISVIAYLELTKACGVGQKDLEGAGAGRLNALQIAGLVAITCYYAIVYIRHPEEGTLHYYPMLQYTKLDTGIMIAMFISLIILMSVYVFAFPRYDAHQVMAAYFSLVYAPMMLSFVFLTRELMYGIYLVWMIFINSWISDTCAYLVGVMFGRHKLAPVLSPKKSVEGAIGGIVGSALVGALYGWYLDAVLETENLVILLFVVGAVGSVISQVGDLAASAIKRNYEIKDYGKLIPGHGGIMDRFDSVIFTAPVTYFLIIFFMR